jgi:polysaccharide export outer membrane protein
MLHINLLNCATVCCLVASGILAADANSDRSVANDSRQQASRAQNDVPRNYLLGPGDQISISVADLPDDFADKTFRVDSEGDLSLPIIGHLQAGGLSSSQLEGEIRMRLKDVLKDPQVSVSIVNFASQSVSVLGSVNNPGIRQLEGHRTLFEVLSESGGLRPDAGYVVNVTRDINRGRIPLPQAQVDASGRSTVAAIKLRDIINATNPAENIIILPGDSISVPRAELVYAVGSVIKPGGFLLNEHESLSAMQVVSLAEGLSKTAASDKARILRTKPGSTDRIEIAVNLKQLMSGKGKDVQLQPNDILFIPNSAAKSTGYRTIESIVSVATGMAMYGHL